MAKFLPVQAIDASIAAAAAPPPRRPPSIRTTIASIAAPGGCTTVVLRDYSPRCVSDRHQTVTANHGASQPTYVRLLSDCARCVCLVRGACDRARPRRRRTLTFDYIHAGLLFVWAGPKTTTTCISFVSIGRHSERRTALCFGLLRALDFARPLHIRLHHSSHSGPTAPTEQQHNLLEYAAYMRG